MQLFSPQIRLSTTVQPLCRAVNLAEWGHRESTVTVRCFSVYDSTTLREYLPPWLKVGT